MDFDTLYPARFMKAGEFNGKDHTFTISDVKLEELGEGAEKKGKAVVTFKDAKKQWVMNRTNGTCLKAMFGRETAAWVGKRVTLFGMQITDPFTGELTLAIRVKGSPDIQESLTFSARIGRKQANFSLKKTGTASAAAPPINVAAWTDEKLSGRLDTLQKWADGARPDHPDMTKTKLEMSIIENELERRMSAAPPPPGDDAPGAENAAGAP